MFIKKVRYSLMGLALSMLVGASLPAMAADSGLPQEAMIEEAEESETAEADEKETQTTEDTDFAPGDYLTVTAESVQLRKTSSLTSKIKANLEKGTIVRVEKLFPAKNSMKISVNDVTGYVANDESLFIKFQAEDVVSSYSKVKQAKIKVGTVPVYCIPAQYPSSQIRLLKKGEMVLAVGAIENQWICISYYEDGEAVTGFIPYASAAVGKLTKNSGLKEVFEDLENYQAKSRKGSIKVYLSPDEDAKVLKTVSKSKKVNLVAQSKHWYQVELTVSGKAVTGYMLRTQAEKIDLLDQLTLKKTSLKIKAGKTKTIKVQGKKNFPSCTITFESENTNLATVTKKGKVKGLNGGTVVITVTITVGNRVKELECTVKVTES